MAKTMNDADILRNENAYLQTKLGGSETKYSNLALIMSQNLENLLTDKQDIMNDLLDQN